MTMMFLELQNTCGSKSVTRGGRMFVWSLSLGWFDRVYFKLSISKDYSEIHKGGRSGHEGNQSGLCWALSNRLCSCSAWNNNGLPLNPFSGASWCL